VAFQRSKSCAQFSNYGPWWKSFPPHKLHAPPQFLHLQLNTYGVAPHRWQRLCDVFCFMGRSFLVLKMEVQVGFAQRCMQHCMQPSWTRTKWLDIKSFWSILLTVSCSRLVCIDDQKPAACLDVSFGLVVVEISQLTFWCPEAVMGQIHATKSPRLKCLQLIHNITTSIKVNGISNEKHAACLFVQFEMVVAEILQLTFWCFWVLKPFWPQTAS